MTDKTQLHSHPLNVQTEKILKAAKIPWVKTKQGWMAITALMMWILEQGVEPLPAWAALENFQDRYVDLEEAVLDLDQHDPEALLALVEDHEGEIVLTEENLEGLSPEEAGAMLLEELRSGMELHPERYQ